MTHTTLDLGACDYPATPRYRIYHDKRLVCTIRGVPGGDCVEKLKRQVAKLPAGKYVLKKATDFDVEVVGSISKTDEGASLSVDGAILAEWDEIKKQPREVVSRKDEKKGDVNNG